MKKTVTALCSLVIIMTACSKQPEETNVFEEEHDEALFMALEKEEYLWRMVNEHMTQARQQETLRSSMTTFLITLSGAIVAFIMFDKKLSFVDLPPAILVLLLGLFGILFSAKHYERFNFHIARVRAYRDALEKSFSEIHWKQLRVGADEYHAARFPRLLNWRQHWLWLILHGVNASIGLMLIGVILFK